MQLCVITVLGSAPTSFSNDATCHLSTLHLSFMFHTFHDDSYLKTPSVNSLKALTRFHFLLSSIVSQEWSELSTVQTQRRNGTMASEDHTSSHVHLLEKRKSLRFHCVSDWFPADIVWQSKSEMLGTGLRAGACAAIPCPCHRMHSSLITLREANPVMSQSHLLQDHIWHICPMSSVSVWGLPWGLLEIYFF